MGIVETKRTKRQALRAALVRIAAVLSLGVVIVAMMYAYNYLTTSPRFSVSQVDFHGINRVEDADVDRMLADLVGHNIMLAPLDSYEARLENHPRIESASLRRVLPNKISCTLAEREPVALVYCDRFVEVDRNGMIMADDEYSPLLDLPVITGVPRGDIEPGKVSPSPRLHNALQALALCKQLGGEFAADISELHVSDRGVSIRSLKDDFVLVLGEADYEKRLRKYFLLKDTIIRRDNRAQMIDLRFEDQVVLRGQI